MDEDFYIEESNPKTVFFICLLILFIIGAGIGAYYYFDGANNIRLKKVTIELGEEVPTDLSYYIKNDDLNNYTLDISLVHTDENGLADSVGEYSFKITKGNETKKGKLSVKDTKAPTVNLRDLTVGLNEEFEPDDFVVSCEDLSGPCYVSYGEDIDYTHFPEANEGTYKITLIIKDKYDNSVSEKVNLIVSEGASLTSEKTADLEVDKLYPVDDDWNGKFAHKFSKGVPEESEEYDHTLLDLINTDYTKKYDKEIVNKTIIVAYNKYDYAIGIIIRLEFSDDTAIYVTE